MESEERSKWEKMASEDKERFEKEKVIYRGPWTVPIGHRKSKVCTILRFVSLILLFQDTNTICISTEQIFRIPLPQSALLRLSSRFPTADGQR